MQICNGELLLYRLCHIRLNLVLWGGGNNAIAGLLRRVRYEKLYDVEECHTLYGGLGHRALILASTPRDKFDLQISFSHIKASKNVRITPFLSLGGPKKGRFYIELKPFSQSSSAKVRPEYSVIHRLGQW